MLGRSLTEIKNIILGKIIENIDIVRALVVNDEDFLNTIPTTEQQVLINNPSDLIRNQIFPYIKKPSDEIKDRVIIMSKFVNFEKVSLNFKQGEIYLYVIVPYSIEKTDYGIRYDFIADKLDELFHNNQIGEFEFVERGDFDVDENYIGHMIKFKMTDFYGW